MATFREEFQLQKLFLNYPSRKPFTTSPWFSLAWFVLYRGAACIFCSIIMLLDTIESGVGYSPAFTMWSFATVNLYFVCAFLLSVVELYNQRKTKNNLIRSTEENKGPLHIVKKEIIEMEDIAEPERAVSDTNKNPDLTVIESESESHRQALAAMTIAHKLQWLLFNVAANNAIIATVGYWGLLVPFSGADSRLVEGESGFMNLTVHGLNAIMMLTEICISALPVRLLHVIYAELYGIVYMLMTLVRWLITKRSIYYFLNFDYPGLAVGFIFSLLLVIQPLVQLLCYGLYSLRGRLERKLIGRDVSSHL